ncbi:DoxX family protein [Glycomyces harbinensis]|uniref:DoxX-like family protein n=1 Tax=Glycomyces harbinensis TaxID=58114 RepID=A0A1G6RQS7_9ACTN|nr:DoxX family protein [Glycomyces harbinensis]SDD06888.1 DoxX-like family protein [Glycomyces harbinensis]
MNVFLWILQGLLAAAFLAASVMKSTQPKEKLAPNMPWVNDFSSGTVKLVGIVELAAAVGLILPALTGIAVILTPLAAVGLVVVMILAAVYHARKKEYSAIGINAVLLVLAAIVAWGRFGPYDF